MNRKLFGRLLFIIVFASVVYALTFLPVAERVTVAVAWAQEHAFAGILLYVAFVVLATVLFLPGSVAMMIGGYLFGFLPGLLIATVAIPLGAQSAFEVGRWFLRDWVRNRVSDNSRMRALEAALNEAAFLIIVLTRLSLIIPFNLLNYFYGATSARASTHFLATAVGMFPAIALYVYLGTIARDLGQILSGDAAPDELGYWLVLVGIIAIVGATWVIHRTATRALQKHLVTEGEPQSSV